MVDALWSPSCERNQRYGLAVPGSSSIWINLRGGTGYTIPHLPSPPSIQYTKPLDSLCVSPSQPCARTSVGAMASAISITGHSYCVGARVDIERLDPGV